MADIGSLLGGLGVGGNIGKAIVQLELETTKYQAELRAAQAQTVASTNASSGAFSKFGGIAQAALLGVGVAAAAGAAISVKAAIEANEAHIKLQNTFENNASLSDSSVEAFEAQADALRELTGVDDEAIISGQALLGQFELTGEQVMELTPLIVDLSAKMGIDLEAAAKAVGKATEGNTGSLARYIGKIEEGATPLETFTNITDKLARVQGFAAERADAEPWRVLGSSFEEVAEQVGQALLPAIQALAESLLKLLPIIEFVAKGIEFLPLVQMAEGFESDANAAEKFGNALLDTIPVLGHYTDITGDLDDELGAVVATAVTYRGVIGNLSDYLRSRVIPATEATTKHFEELHFTLDDVADSTDVSRREFITYFRTLERNALELRDAARELRDEKWLDRDFVDFLSEKGPQWIVEFSDLNEEKQRKWQESWDESNRRTKSANENLDIIRTTLDQLDRGESKHKVTIEYDYVGFDPSKPGMSGGATSNQQR